MVTRKVITIALGIILLGALTVTTPALSASVGSIVDNMVIQTEDGNGDVNHARPEPGPFLQEGDTRDQGDDDDGGDQDDGAALLNGQHPVANALAQEFNLTNDEIVALRQEGYGFGQIAKAYSLADELGMAPRDVLSQARDIGWGRLLKDHGLHPSLAGKGNNLGAIMSKHKGNRPAHAGPPGGNGPPGLMKKRN